MKELRIANLALGLHTEMPPDHIPPGAASDCSNVIFSYGDVRVRPGRSIAAEMPASTPAGLGSLTEFYVDAGGAATDCQLVGDMRRRLYWTTAADQSALAAITNATYAYDPASHVYKLHEIVTPSAGANGYVYEVTTAGTSTTEPTWSTTVGGTNAVGTTLVFTCRALPKVRYQQFQDNLYLVDGISHVQYLTKAGALTSLIEFDPPTVAPTVTLNAVGLSVSLSGGVSDQYGGQSTIVNTPLFQFPFFGQAYEAGTFSDGYHWRHSTGMNLNIWYPYTYDAVYPTTAHCEGVTMRGISTTSTMPDYRVHGSCVALEFVENSTPPGVPMACGNVWGMRKLNTTLDLSDATSLYFQIYWDSGDATPVIPTCKMIVGQDDTQSNWQEVPMDLSSVVANATTYIIHVDISDAVLAKIYKRAVKYIGFKFDTLIITAKTRLQNTGLTGLYPNRFLYANTRGAAILFGEIKANISTADFTPADYKVTYTYYDATDGESGEFKYPGPAPVAGSYTEFNVSLAIPQNITFTVTKDALTAATDAYVYVKGGTSSDWRRVGTIDLTGTARSVDWTGTYTSDMEFLTPYVGKPPAGCTIMTVYRGRMVYAGRAPGDTGARDTIHISNYNDPTLVPQVPGATLEQSPLTYGGWYTVGNPGEEITGLAYLGSYMLVFKNHAIYLVSGEPGQTDFNIEVLTHEHGCISPDSVCSVDGGFVLWQDLHKITAWSGQQFQNIGYPVNKQIKGDITQARQETSVTTYDSINRRVMITYPNAALAATPASTTYVYDLNSTLEDGTVSPSWTRYDAQPNGGYVMSLNAATPGVYASDKYSGNATYKLGKIFLLTGTATTDSISDITPTYVPSAIAWYWQGAEMREPGGVYKDIPRVKAITVSQTATAGDEKTLLIAIWPNNDYAKAMSRACTILGLTAYVSYSDYTGRVLWYPPRTAAMVSYLLKLSGSNSKSFGVKELSLYVQERAPVMGMG